ncbi:SDR family oxidoreductase [Bacillaceae bacterium S4-13-58]
MKHALVTAGSKGLGRQVVESFIEKECSVTVTYHKDLEKAESLLQRYPHHKDRIHIVQADVTKKEDIDRVMESVMERFQRIDYLVHNAGPYIFERKKIADYTEQEWNQMIQGNLTSVFHFYKKAIPVMREQHFGRIITYGFQGAGSAAGWIYRGAFAAAKVGLVSLTKTIAYEEAENGITANMVCPGNITGSMKEATIEESRRIRDEVTPIGRSGTGEDIARIVDFLCQGNSDLITGAVIDATGGLDVIHRFR